MIKNKRAAVAFDLDGTLIDSRADIVKSVNYTMRHYGLSDLPYNLVVSYVGNGAQMLIRRSFGENLSRIDIEEAVKVFRSYYLVHCTDETFVFPNIEECLTKIKKNAYLLFVITNKPSPHSEKILKHFGIYNLIDRLFCQDTMKALKPDPITIFELISKFDIDPNRFYMVGDSRVDMDFAAAGGIKSIMVGYGGAIPYEEFVNTPSDFKAKSTEDLLKIFDNILKREI